MDRYDVSHLVPEQGFPYGGLDGDLAVQHIPSHGGDDAERLFLLHVHVVNDDGVVDSDLVLLGFIGNDLGGLEHPLQIADPAFIFTAELLCGVIFEIFAAVSLSGGFGDVFCGLLADNDFPVFQFGFDFGDVAFGQFLSHLWLPLFLSIF